MCENNKQTLHDYTNKLWDLSLYFWDLYNRWVLASQQKALGPCKCTRFRVMQTYRNYSFSYFDALLPQKRLILSLLMRTISSPEIFTKKCQQQQNFDSDPKEAWHYNNVTFTPIAKNFMLYCRLIYMLSMLYVRLTIKVKVGIPESFKVGWHPPKITWSSLLNAGPHVWLLLHTSIVLGGCYELLFLLILFCY